MHEVHPLRPVVSYSLRPTPSRSCQGVSTQTMKFVRCGPLLFPQVEPLKKPSWNHEPVRRAIWLWTTESDNHSAPNVLTLPQDVVLQWSRLLFNPKLVLRSARHPSLPRTCRGYSFASHPRGIATRRGVVGTKSVRTATCTYCNYVNREGVLSGAISKRSCLHHVPVSSRLRKVRV